MELDDSDFWMKSLRYVFLLLFSLLLSRNDTQVGSEQVLFSL